MNEHGCMIVSLERLKSRLNLFQVFKRTQGYFAPTLCYAIFQLLIECTGRGYWELGLPWRKQRGWIQMLVANLGTGSIQQAQNVCVLRSYLFYTCDEYKLSNRGSNLWNIQMMSCLFAISLLLTVIKTSRSKISRYNRHETLWHESIIIPIYTKIVILVIYERSEL